MTDPPRAPGARTVVQAVPHATTFIRGPALELARRLDRLELRVRHNPLTGLAGALPAVGRVPWLRRYRWSASGVALAWPENVKVAPLSAVYLRRDGSNPTLGHLFGRRLAAQLRGRADVRLLHGHFLHPFGLAAVRAARRLGLPSVVTGHGGDVYDVPNRSPEWAAAIAEACDHADAVTTVSARQQAALLRLGVARDKLRVIPNGFDPRQFHVRDSAAARAALGLPPGGKLLLAVASLVPVKAHADLLEAFAAVLPGHPGLRLALVGGGPLEGALRAQAERLGISQHVRFAGMRPHAEVPLWMAAADLYVLSSRAEGCVTVVQEALGAGLPVVATDVGQVPEVVTARNGRMAPVGSPQGLAAAIGSALAADFDRHAIARDAQGLTWEANALATLQVYERLVPGLTAGRTGSPPAAAYVE